MAVDAHDEQVLVANVERDAHSLATSVKAATEAGVSEALIFPALVGVFREAGMIPEGWDVGGILSMFS